MKKQTDYILFLMMLSMGAISGLFATILFFFAKDYHPEVSTYFLGMIVGFGFAAVLIKDIEE